MDIFELIKTRRSIRNFEPKPVIKETITKVINAGLWAPSSRNQQPWRFAVADDSETISGLAAEGRKMLVEYLQTEEALERWGEDSLVRFLKRTQDPNYSIFYNAPAVIFVINSGQAYNQFDFGLAVMNIMLAAHGMGLGTCPVGLSIPMNRSEMVREKLGMEEGEEIVISLLLGYPNESPQPTERDFDRIDWV
jgi:nitroreductase